MLKKLLIGLIALLALAVLGVLVAIWNINPILERLRPQITKTISDAVKHPVQLGELTASLFPEVVVEVRDVALVDQAEAASVKRLYLKTALGDLLGGKLSVSQLSLEDATIRLTKKSDGTLFIGTLPLAKKAKSTAQLEPLVRTVADTSTAGQTAEAQTAGAAEESVTFAVDAISIKNVLFTFIDEHVKPTQEIVISDLTADISNVLIGQTANFDLSATVLSDSKQNFTLSGKALVAQTLPPNFDATLAFKHLNLEQLAQLAKAYGSDPAGLRLGKTASLALKASSGNQGMRVTLDSLDATAAQIAFGEIFAKAAGVPLTLVLDAQPSLLGAVVGEKLELRLGEIVASAPFSFNPSRGTSATLNSEIKLAGLGELFPMAKAFELQGTVKPDFKIQLPTKSAAGAKPTGNGTVKIQGVGARIPVGKTAASPGTVLAIRDTNGSLELAGETLKIPSLSATVADQKLSLNATATPLTQPQVEYNLNSEKLALGPILDSVVAGGVPALANAAFEGLALSGTYSAKARGGKTDLKFANGTLAGTGLSAGSFSTQYQLTPDNQLEKADLQPSSLKLFGGTLNLQGKLSNQHSVTAAVRATAMQIEPLSKLAMSGGKFSATGTLESLALDIQGDKRNFKPTLGGQLTARAVNGQIIGINILRETLSKINQIPGLGSALTSAVPEKYRPLVEGDSTSFDSLVINSGLGNQTVQLRDFTLSNPLYILTGQGQIGFGGTLDLDAQMRLTPLVAQQLILKQPKLQLLADSQGNIVIPVKIKKDQSILVLPDVGDLTIRAVENTAKEAAKRGLDRVQPGLGQALDSLFK